MRPVRQEYRKRICRHHLSIMSKGSQGTLRIGTSNIVVPFSKEFFPDAFKGKSRLNYYSSIFNTVEINGTFKKIPRLSTFGKWADDVPERFQFTVKMFVLV